MRVQDVNLASSDDPLILEWAAAQGRVIVTADLKTMIGFAQDRVKAGLPMPGLIALSENAANHRVIEDILIVANLQTVEEINNQIVFIPI